MSDIQQVVNQTEVSTSIKEGRNSSQQQSSQPSTAIEQTPSNKEKNYTDPKVCHDPTFEIEHIFAINRQEKERVLKNNKNLEAIGNKAMLEKRINIRASDYRFSDKIKYYRGFVNLRNQKKEGTNVYELADMAESRTDFVEADIETRTGKIFDGFIDYLRANDLIAE